MKKTVFFLLAAFAVASCNDDCDHGFVIDRPISDLLVGSWYEETQNEEDTYSASGTFYGRFCNTLVQGDGRGTYFIDSERNRLTWSYNVNGSSQMSDWKLTNVSDVKFTMSSDVAILTYGKIVEIYNMEGGDTKQITFNQGTISGYESKNSNIATVTSEGLITATGEKGTTYIKIKSTIGDVWAKVIVGGDTPDLWIDYSYLLGRDFVAMRDTLGTHNQSQDFGEYTSYSYIISTHNIIDYINVYVDNNSHAINQIDIHIREGVTQEEILAYMNAHYYKIDGNFGKQYHYSTSSTLVDSRATYAYDSENKTVLIMTADSYEEIMNPAPWPRFNKFFGLNKEQAQKVAEGKGWKYYEEYDSYSENGSVAYTFGGYDYSYAIELVYNSKNVVSQCVVYVQSETPDRLLLSYLDENDYVEAESEKTMLKHVYYNSGKTQKVEYDILTKTLYFTDLTQEPFDRVILGTYWKGMGMNQQQLVDAFGEPYRTAEDNITYIVFNDYIQYVGFRWDVTSGKVVQINMQLQDAVNDDEVIAYLNKKYHFSESEETEQGPRMRWLNAENKENATLRTTYYPDYNMIVYGVPQ